MDMPDLFSLLASPGAAAGCIAGVGRLAIGMTDASQADLPVNTASCAANARW